MKIPQTTIIDGCHLWVCRSFVRDHKRTALRSFSLKPDPKGKVYISFFLHSQPSQSFCNLVWHGHGPFPQQLQPIISVAWWNKQSQQFRCDLTYIWPAAWPHEKPYEKKWLGTQSFLMVSKVTLCKSAPRKWPAAIPMFSHYHISSVILSLQLVASQRKWCTGYNV